MIVTKTSSTTIILCLIQRGTKIYLIRMTKWSVIDDGIEANVIQTELSLLLFYCK